MAIPSIAVIPSGYKAGKVYSVLPANVDAYLTFTRADGAGNGKGSRVNQNGLIEIMDADVPRLDYTNGGCPSLLLEPTSTNLFTNSEDLSAWSQLSNATITANNAVSPDGLLTADLLIPNAQTGSNFIINNSNITVGLDYTQTVYAKKGGYDFIQIGSSSGFSNFYCNFDLTNGIVGSKTDSPSLTASIEELTNGYFRIRVTAVSTITGSGRMVFSVLDSDRGSRLPSQTTDGVSGVYLWGAQLEQQSQPTSYIKTTGAIATRLADVAYKTGLESYINSTEGALYLDTKYLGLTNNSSLAITLSDSSAFTRVGFSISPSGSLSAEYRNNGTYIYSQSLGDLNTFKKIAIYWSASKITCYVNGVEVGTPTLGGVRFPSNSLNKFSFGSATDTLNYFGNVNDLRVYNTALTDAELQTLTTM